MEDKKRDYLIKTFSRTKRKDYENYILTSIWHRLGRNDIKPVTQQYIKRSDGKYALVDLYFPQLNIGIECDEEQHIHQYEEDKTREITMEEMLSSYEETSNFKLMRVIAYNSLESIDREIEDILDIINDRINDIQYEPWNVDENYIEQAIKKGSISVGDPYRFHKINDICECFGKNYNGMQRSYFSLTYGYQMWCPKLAKYEEGESKPISHGWINELTGDWNQIIERNDDIKLNNISSDKYINKKRITFAQSKDALGNISYRFVGVFEIDLNKSNENGRVYNRVSDEIQLVPFFNFG